LQYLTAHLPWLQDEFEATKQNYVMYRPYIHALLTAVKGQKMKQLLLDGMPGAGKSIAVATLALWARQAGWVVSTDSFYTVENAFACRHLSLDWASSSA